MSRVNRGWKRWKRGLGFYGTVLVLFLVLAVSTLHVLQQHLLTNTQQMGNVLAHSFSVEEERNLSTYETLLELGATYMNSQIESGATEDELRDWMQAYLTHITNIMGSSSIDPFAVVNGTIVAANYWEGDETYDYTKSNWYQAALDAGGEVIYTDAYQDAITGRSVITLAAQVGEGENVIAFDVFPENFHLGLSPLDLPENSSYFLCDRNGTLLYSQTSLERSTDVMQDYIQEILAGIESGQLTGADSFIKDLDGRQRAVYYNVAENGWISIITVPYRTILADLGQLTLRLSVVFLLFAAFAVFMAVRDYRTNRQMERTNETVRVLGNSYYAIYRIDFTRETYEAIKGSDYVRERLPKQGDYNEFLRVMGDVIEESVYSEFLKSFSMENIQTLVARRVRDFGGDFLRRFGQEYRWVDVRMLFDESLSQGEVVLCFREIEGEKQRQLEQMRLLKDALDTAKKNEESQSRFFSTVSHDMRTPLNAILGLAELAEHRREEPEAVGEYLGKIRRSGQYLLDLINDILEISRLEKGNIQLNHEPFDLQKCVTDCAEVFRSQAQAENKPYTVTFELRDRRVIGDPARLTQVLNNLLSNAFKFTVPGDSVSLHVRQIENQAHAKYQIIVSDTGAGMTQEFLDRIFVPYERETHFGARNVAGTGLGMPIVKSIVSQMDGQIVVDSTLGKGSTFTVTLPLEVENQAGAGAEPEPATSPERTDNLAGRRILLAEDNEVNMEIATEMLAMYGMEVTQAWNGREAVEQFQASEPFTFDAVLMDMQMPEMDGCQAAKAIRALHRPDAAKVPILAVTANAFAEDIAATTKAGMDAHISKPIDFSILCRTLSELIGTRS